MTKAPLTVAGLLRAMQPVDGMALPCDFAQAMRMVCRPVVPITRAQYDAVLARGKREQCDVYAFKGGWVTYGTADGGYALWPLLAKPLALPKA